MPGSTQVWMDLLWRGALAATIPALVIAVIGRFLTIRPPTRHTLWLIVLAWFVVAPLLPSAPHGKIASLLTPKSEYATEAQRAPRREENKSLSVPLSRRVDNPPQQESIHAWTGPSVPARLARAPRPVGHGLTTTEKRRPQSGTDASSKSKDVSMAVGWDRAPIFAHEDVASKPLRRSESKPVDIRPTETTSTLQATYRNKHKRLGQKPIAPAKIEPLFETVTAAPSVEMESPSAIAVWIDSCRGFAASLKNAASQIPPIPPIVWFAGILLILFARGLAYARFTRCVRNARRAPSGIQRMVRRSARDIGVTPAPQVLMIAGRFSPMVSFIGKRRLLLPTELWSQLDEPGRQAIVYHELAHLRRRDDWVRWFESVVNCLYWWHPVVWWLCRRLRDEAENCCDAWVTWLMPKGRRAYAEALLTTSRYVGSSSTALPVVGIGATSVRAKRFARRLTMVMTNPSRPRMSLPGTALAAALALGAWLATPAWSSPPKAAQPDTPKPADIAAAPVMATTPAVPSTPCSSMLPTPAVATTTVTPRPMTPITPPALFNAIGTSVAKSLMSATDYPPRRRQSSDDDELEARLERLERRLEELTERLADRPPTPRGAFAVEMPSRPAIPGALAVTLPRAPSAPGMPGADGEKEWRHYELPDGKLEALIGLMSRDDVPVLIRPQDGGIDVEATTGQHEVFEAFVRLIHPSEGDAAPGTPRPPRARMPAPPSARAGGPGRAPAALRQKVDYVRSLVDAKEAEMEALEAQKEHMESLAETLQERVEAMKESAEGLKDRAKADMQKQVAELVRQAKAMAAETENIEQAVARMAEELRGLEGKADQMEDQAEAEDVEVNADDADDADESDEASAARELDRALKSRTKTHAVSHERVRIKEKDQERAKALHKADELFTRHEWKEAAAEYEKFIETHADDGRVWYNLGYSYHMAKQFDRAFKAFGRSAELGARKGDSLYNIACGYSLSGEKDQAIQWLQKAVDAGYGDTNNMNGDSDLDNIRDDPRYQKIVEKLGDSEGGV